MTPSQACGQPDVSLSASLPRGHCLTKWWQDKWKQISLQQLSHYLISQTAANQALLASNVVSHNWDL